MLAIILWQCTSEDSIMKTANTAQDTPTRSNWNKAAEAEAMTKPIGVKMRNRRRKTTQELPALLFSHTAEYKVKCGF